MSTATASSMSGTKMQSADLGPELFRCLPKSLYQYAKLRYQGALPTPGWSYLGPVAAVTSPIAESMILGAFPLILFIIISQKLLGLEPPHEPAWVRPVALAILACCFPSAMWWCWMAPRNDGVIVCEHGFRWQVSLSHWTWLRSRGTIQFKDLESFSYRTDCFENEPADCGRTPSDKLAWLILELRLSHFDIAFRLKNEKVILVEKFFARFMQDDLQRFVDHLRKVTEPQPITMTPQSHPAP